MNTENGTDGTAGSPVQSQTEDLTVCVHVLSVVSSGFSGFLPPSKTLPLDGLAMVICSYCMCVSACVWCPVMDCTHQEEHVRNPAHTRTAGWCCSSHLGTFPPPSVLPLAPTAGSHTSGRRVVSKLHEHTQLPKRKPIHLCLVPERLEWHVINKSFLICIDSH